MILSKEHGETVKLICEFVIRASPGAWPSGDISYNIENLCTVDAPADSAKSVFFGAHEQ